jgi:hypothetical protein
MHPTNVLCLQQPLTRWIVLQKARRHRTSRLRLLVRAQFQVLFHSHPWVLLTFPSRYLFSIDRKIYLALGGGPPSFNQGFTCPDLLDIGNIRALRHRYFLGLRPTNMRLATLRVPGYHRLWPTFPGCSARLANLWTSCKMVVALASNTDIWINPELRTGGLYVTTPSRYSSTNLFAYQ